MGEKKFKAGMPFTKNTKSVFFSNLGVRIGKLSRKSKIVAAVIILIFAVIMINIFSKAGKSSGNLTDTYTVEQVKRMDIASALLENGTLAPRNEYKVTSLVTGKIISADFEEGDYVKTGQCLYTLDTDEVQIDVKASENTLARAKRSRKTAVKDYHTALKRLEKADTKFEESKKQYAKALKKYSKEEMLYKDLKITADKAGIIKKLYVNEGDTIQKGAKIADIYDSRVMKLEVPFNAKDICKERIGKKAEVEIVGSFETLSGKVTDINDAVTVLAGNQMVRMVTISVNNLGGITNATTATASIGNIVSSSSGTFDYGLETALSASKSGDITVMKIKEGKSIQKGDTLLLLDGDKADECFSVYETEYTAAKSTYDQAEETVNSAKDAVEKAKDVEKSALDSIEDAKAELDSKKDKLKDYSITAPISGKVVKKKALKGDKISNNDLSTEMAVIYDLDVLTFQMPIDELDIMSVKVDQKVSVTAEALEGEEYTGKITNVSLISDATGGVTKYPVTVRIDKPGSLLPGMNVKGKIETAHKENVLAVLVDAVIKENQVYVQDASVTEANQDVPAGFRAAEVELGISDGQYIEVVSGLSETDKVYVKRNLAGATDGSGWMYEE
jgi:HlyD family secretion protein